jgi:YD repeat-containing protein
MERHHVSTPASHRPLIGQYAAIDIAPSAGRQHSNLNSALRVFAYFALIGFWSLSLAAWPQSARAAGAQYVYDWGGRLIQVVAPDGSSAQYNYDPAGNLLAITPLSASTAALVGFSNPSALPGSTITLYGNGFSTTPSANTVLFNGVAATVVSSTANALTVIVPAGATSGIITVTNSHGTVSSANSFSAITGPSISSFTPTIGSTGTVVTVNGSGFLSATSRETVSFGGVGAQSLTATASVLTAGLPKGASSGKIAVTTPWGTTLSANDFFAVPAGFTTANVSSTGRLTVGGTPLTVSIGTPSSIGLLIFDATAGQGLSLQLSGSTFNYCASGDYFLVNSPGPQIVSVPVSYDAHGLAGSGQLCNYTTGFIVPVSGTYSLVLATDAYDTGSVTTQLQNAPPVNASINIDGSPVTVTTTVPGQQAQLTFTTTSANQIVSGAVSASTFPAACSWQMFNLIGPAPSTALIGVGGGNLCTSGFATTYPTVGTYTLRVSPYNADIGSVTIQLRNAPTLTAPISIDGAAVTVSTTAPAQQAQLTFTPSTVNQRVSIQFSGSTYPNCYSDQWAINGPANNAFGLGNFCTNTYGVTTGAIAPYTIYLTPSGLDTGSVTVQLQTSSPAIAPISIGGPAVAVSTGPVQLAELPFTTTSANQIVTFQVSGSTYPTGCGLTHWQVIGPAPSTSVIAPSRAVINWPDSSVEQSVCTSADSVNLPTAGSYTIVVTPSDTGSVTFQLQNPVAPVTAPISIGGAPVTVTNTAPGQLAQLSFTTSSANQTVVLSMNGTIGALYVTLGCSNPAWEVIGPAPATTIISSADGCQGAFPITLPTVGTYSIVMTPYGQGHETYQLQNAPPYVAPISIGGSAVTETTTVPGQQATLTFNTTSANQIVSLQVSGSTYVGGCGFATWQLIGPSPATATIAAANVCANAYAVQLPVAGTYTIVVSTNYFTTGSATFQLQNAPVVTASISIGGAPVTVTTTVPAQQAQLTFSTTSASQLLHVVVSGSTYPTGCTNPTVALNGPAPGANLIGTTNLCPNITIDTLANVGTYTLTVTPWSNDTGNVTLQLY